MKKSIQNIALLNILFVLGACSVAEGDFLKKVEGKFVYNTATSTSESAGGDCIGQFSADGKILNEILKFIKATDENTALYESKRGEMAQVFTISTTDGKTGTFKNSVNSVPADNGKIWFETTERK